MRELVRLVDSYLLRPLPPRLGRPNRIHAWRFLGADVSSSVQIGPGVGLLHPAGLTVQHGASIARDVTLDARGGLWLEEHALIGFESILLTSTHNSEQLGRPVQDQGMFSAPIRIGPRAWLGARTIVLPGVRIGEDAIIGSGSIVSRDVPDRAVAVGVPAKVIRTRT